MNLSLLQDLCLADEKNINSIKVLKELLHIEKYRSAFGAER